MWDHSSRKHGKMTKRSEYALTEKEKKFLQTGDPSTYSKSEMRRRIRNKRQKLAPRFQTLIDDVSLMYSSGYFDEDGAKKDWKKIHNLVHNINNKLNRKTNREKIGGEGAPEGVNIYRTETIEEFGHLIGSLFHVLMSGEKEPPWEELLRGIMIFYVIVPDGKPVDRVKMLNEIADFSHLQYMAEHILTGEKEEARSARDFSSEYAYKAFIEDHLFSFEEAIHEFLNENNIPVNDILVDEIHSEIDYRNATFPYSARVAYNKIAEQSPLFEIIQLHILVRDDVRLLNKDWRGPDKNKILESVFNSNSAPTSREIASDIDAALSDNLVTTALNKMSNESDESDLWTEYRLFDNQNDRWELTLYGKVCAYYITNQQTTENAFYKYGLEKEDIEDEYDDLISDILNEVDLDRRP